MTEPQVGSTIHFLVAGVGFHAVVGGVAAAFVSRRGQELHLSEATIEANRDRLGNLPPWLLQVTDPDAQLRTFGQQIVGAGSWPVDFLLTLPGESEHEEARVAALENVRAIADPAARADARRAVDDLFGPAPRTSRTHGVYSGTQA